MPHTFKTDAYGNRRWYNHASQRHREDGPAIEYADGSKSWYRNGLLHREDGPAIEWPDGSRYWYRNGQIHREDGPAVECADGSKYWYRNGQLHREDGPAIEWAGGGNEWYLNGICTTEKKVMNKISKLQFPDRIEYRNSNNQLHREDGPAVEWANGHKSWYRNDQRHREDGPAVEYADGTKEWYRNDQIHREDGPAVECADGSKYWYRNGQLHREDGPAIEWAGGGNEWYLNGICTTEKKVMNKISKLQFPDRIEYRNSNNQLHREDGPAVEWANGHKSWYRNGRYIVQPPQHPDQTTTETPKIKPTAFDQILSLLVDNPDLINKTSETVLMLQQHCEEAEEE